ncbi:trypsin-like serine peptidase [Mangrovimicrobium sediminis]|uniref:trypsin-like serine peptidase n=1 Tax=Mangrovimicrobium sediminis TaxID=2562682 RepID=UPI0014369458|nr:trypsin-like peptidase domain-containing protein [Haliea sp. SAOS-164]
MPRTTIGQSLLATLLCSLPLAALAGGEDARRVFSADSPDWLRAVGKLQVPAVRYEKGYSRHRRENCSATLVTAGADKDANTLVTAWHCLEDYSDLSKPITVSLLTASGERLEREAYSVADGGGMQADWALLKLYQRVPRQQVPALLWSSEPADGALPVTMAGYSGDAGLGAGGTALTYDAGCRITRQNRAETESDCRAFKGASGGAVVQLDPAGVARLYGVVSRGDGVSVSIFVPVSGFHRALRRHLD